MAPAPCPFRIWMEDRRLQIEIPGYARIKARNGFGWRTVHNGYHWASQGIIGEKPRHRFSFLLRERIQVGAHGRVWEAGIVYPPGVKPKKNLTVLFQENRFFTYSVAGHLAALVFLLIVNHAGRLFHQNGQAGALKELAAKRGSQPPVPVGYSFTHSIRPYQGISYTRFRERLQDKGKDLGDVVKNLARLNFSGNARTVRFQDLGQGAVVPAVLTDPGAMGSGLAGAIMSQQFFVEEEPDSELTKRLTAKERAELKEKFRGFGDDFRRIYSRLLSMDPNLAVTVMFEAQVTPNGYLLLSSFKARGTYQSSVLAMLQSGMADVMKNAFVGTKLAGVLIRGENVFVH